MLDASSVKQPSATAEPGEEMDKSSVTFVQRLRKVLTVGRVEERGIQPLPLEERTSTQYYHAFTVWFSINTNILA
jgi:hypothetical protein